jgi:tRNA pseudouridine38-40 synthase
LTDEASERASRPLRAQGPLYRIDLAYVGTTFDGWQSQASGNAVQDHLEKALSTMLRHPVRALGASRTDAGVHAEMQVASFATEVAFDAERWIKSLNGLLPRAIGVKALAPADAGFHPILSARGKTYVYKIWRGLSRDPFLAPLAWGVHKAIDVDSMRSAAAAFVGTHDFTSFCAADSSAKTRTRTVSAVEVAESGPLVTITVSGGGFLKQMVRTMAGALVEAGAGRLGADDIARMLAAKDRRVAPATAPACGLTLLDISY